MKKRKLKQQTLQPFSFFRATVSYKSNKTVAPNILVANIYAEYIATNHFEAIQAGKRFAKACETDPTDPEKIKVIVSITVSNVTLCEIDESGKECNLEHVFFQWQDTDKLNNRSVFKK